MFFNLIKMDQKIDVPCLAIPIFILSHYCCKLFKKNIQFLLINITEVMLSHPFDGIPTFALTDYTPRILCRQTIILFLKNKIFFKHYNKEIFLDNNL